MGKVQNACQRCKQQKLKVGSWRRTFSTVVLRPLTSATSRDLVHFAREQGFTALRANLSNGDPTVMLPGGPKQRQAQVAVRTSWRRPHRRSKIKMQVSQSRVTRGRRTSPIAAPMPDRL